MNKIRASGAYILAAIMTIVAAGVLFGEDPPTADSSKVVISDSSSVNKADSAVADTANATADTALTDTSASLAAADTATALTDTSSTAAVSSDSVKTIGDTAEALSGNDTAAAQVETKPPLKDSALFKWIAVNLFYIIFFIVSIASVCAAIYVLANRHDPRRFLTTTRLSVLDKMVQKGCRHIETNYADPELSVSAVCRELVTGEAYLDTLFLKEIGIDVRDFIAQVRVNRIKNILTENPDTDIETAYKQCGFTDKTAADRCFSKLCGGASMEIYAKSLVSAGKTPPRVQ